MNPTSLFVLFLTTEILDGVLTFYGIYSGRFMEANFLVAWLIEKCGLFSGLAMAKGAAIIIGAWMYHRGAKDANFVFALKWATFVMCFVVVYQAALLIVDFISSDFLNVACTIYFHWQKWYNI